MGFLHGVSTDARYDEMSPLDRALEAYQHKAKKYFKKLNQLESAPQDVRERRKQELAAVKVHLEHERRLMESIADVQAQLEIYRDFGRQAIHVAGQSRADSSSRQNSMLAEEHHPTDQLEAFMRAVPNPKPSPNHTAHHITPGKGKTKFAYRARVRMHVLGVRINDPDNGVWLPRFAKHTPHWSMPEALGHLQYHTEGYEKWVADKLQGRSSESALRLELQLIGQRLQENNLPPETRKKNKGSV
ncbi:AHH domain-containing protein [Cellvibrio sp. PSBB023]|uniref:AHH domain-containing protein n=1 Tax=Cellvibrio sp. PSBB023 TaxID=1945512 RepID=UPI00098EA6A0|nr:AHH domain-containing protein [Cellvibrio sp. PSBB023]AQT61459.1 hypothetical protein B0D95_16095 [Cellvibrio sp. PSBB023]